MSTNDFHLDFKKFKEKLDKDKDFLIVLRTSFYKFLIVLGTNTFYSKFLELSRWEIITPQISIIKGCLIKIY